MKARIIVPTDGSEPARWAAEFVCRALRVPAKACDVTLVHVETPFPVRARSVLGREVVHELHERASSKAVESARRLGSHGRGAAKALMLGSAAQRVLARCTVPALVVR